MTDFQSKKIRREKKWKKNYITWNLNFAVIYLLSMTIFKNNKMMLWNFSNENMDDLNWYTIRMLGCNFKACNLNYRTHGRVYYLVIAFFLGETVKSSKEQGAIRICCWRLYFPDSPAGSCSLIILIFANGKSPREGRFQTLVLCRKEYGIMSFTSDNWDF